MFVCANRKNIFSMSLHLNQACFLHGKFGNAILITNIIWDMINIVLIKKTETTESQWCMALCTLVHLKNTALPSVSSSIWCLCHFGFSTQVWWIRKTVQGHQNKFKLFMFEKTMYICWSSWNVYASQDFIILCDCLGLTQ